MMLGAAESGASPLPGLNIDPASSITAAQYYNCIVYIILRYALSSTNSLRSSYRITTCHCARVGAVRCCCCRYFNFTPATVRGEERPELHWTPPADHRICDGAVGDHGIEG